MGGEVAAVAPARTRTGLTVVVETGEGGLAMLDDRWDDLVARQPLPNPLLTAAWLRELARWRTGLPFVVAAESDGTLVAGAALELRRPGGRLGPTVATWLGPVEQIISAGAAAQNILVAAHALGFGGFWRTGPAAYDDGVKALEKAFRRLGITRLQRLNHHLEILAKPLDQRSPAWQCQVLAID